MKRRDFVKTSAAVGAGAMLAPYIAKGVPYEKLPMETLGFLEANTILIIVELFGGNDGLNTIIPLHMEDKYKELRPRINISRADARRFADSDVYFHPAMVDSVHRDGMLGLFERGNLAVVQNVGYEDMTLSHFLSQQIWLSGINVKDPRDPRLFEGWLGRYFLSKLPDYPSTIPEHPLAIALDGTVPLLFKTELGHMAISLLDPEKFYEQGGGLSPKDPIMQGDSLYNTEYNFVHTIARQSQEYSEAIYNAYQAGKDKIQVNYTSGSEFAPTLSDKFKLISQLIAGGLKTKVYYIRQSNYDSHAQQMNDPHSGQHPTLLRDLSRGISEFMDDAIKQGWSDRVAGMTISEFGRRVYDNGSRGSDHGTASMGFVFAADDYVNGATYGQPPDLEDLDSGNLRTEYDFRRVYSNVLNSWFGATQDEIDTIFGDSFLPLPILANRVLSVENPLAGYTGRELNVYPNPSRGMATLRFELKMPSKVKIGIYNHSGQRVALLESGYLGAGYHEYPVHLGQSGTYVINVIAGNKTYAARLNVVM